MLVPCHSAHALTNHTRRSDGGRTHRSRPPHLFRIEDAHRAIVLPARQQVGVLRGEVDAGHARLGAQRLLRELRVGHGPEHDEAAASTVLLFGRLRVRHREKVLVDAVPRHARHDVACRLYAVVRPQLLQLVLRSGLQ